MKRIKKFGVYQTSKVVAIIYFLIIAIFMVPFGLLSGFTNQELFHGFPFGSLILILAPFLYAFIAFIMTAIGCLLYNFIAKHTGGIEVEVELEKTEYTA